MSYVLQRNLRRSRKAHRIALALFFALLAVLLVSVYTGIRHLAISQAIHVARKFRETPQHLLEDYAQTESSFVLTAVADLPQHQRIADIDPHR